MLSCLYITYNRSDLLEQSLGSIRDNLLTLPILTEFIVSDDFSSQEHRARINSLAFDASILAERNEGLGANCNKGISACKGNYVLQLQDDWIFIGIQEDILSALEILETDPQVGIVQLNSTGSDLPYEEKKTSSGVSYRVFANDLLPWKRNCGFRPYSDQPHIKRRKFIDDVGPYLEGGAMTVMENQYKKRVANQNKWKVACFSKTDPLFQHIGEKHSFRLARTSTLVEKSRIDRRIVREMRSRARVLFDIFDSIIAKAVHRVRS